MCGRHSQVLFRWGDNNEPYLPVEVPEGRCPTPRSARSRASNLQTNPKPMERDKAKGVCCSNQMSLPSNGGFPFWFPFKPKTSPSCQEVHGFMSCAICLHLSRFTASSHGTNRVAISPPCVCASQGHIVNQSPIYIQN